MKYRSTQRKRGGDPRVEDLVTVTLTGPARAVVTLTHALDSVAVVTSLRRRVEPDATIHVEATCHRPRPAGKRAPR